MNVILSGLDGGDHASVHKEVGAGDEGGLVAQEELGCGSDLGRVADTLYRRSLDHLLVTLTGSIELIVRQGSDDDTGADGVDAGAASAPVDGSLADAQLVGTLGQYVCITGVRDGRI